MEENGFNGNTWIYDLRYTIYESAGLRE